MKSHLISLITDAGLLQFGSFTESGGEHAPLHVSFEMLASYPAVLVALADSAAPLVAAGEYSRLLCNAEALPFGVALSLKTGVPLVYSRGRGESAVVDLVGGYDIGHRTLLVLNTLDGDPFSPLWVQRASGVGLDAVAALAILALGQHVDNANSHTLLYLDDVINDLATHGELPVGHAAVVRKWMLRF